MNLAGVCLVVACMLYSFSESNVTQASPTPQPDLGKTFFEFEDSDIFKPTSSIRGVLVLRDQKDPEFYFSSNLCDDSECLLIKIDCVPNIIEKKKSEDRLNQLFEESDVSTPEAEQEYDGFDPLKGKRGFHKYEISYWIGDVKSVEKTINGLRGKKSDEYVGDGFDPGFHEYENMGNLRDAQLIINNLRCNKSQEYVGDGFDPGRGKREFHEYEKTGDLRKAQQIVNGLRGKKSEEYVGDEFDPSRDKRVFHEYENRWILKFI